MKGYPRFVSMQNLYNLLYREDEREMNPLCTELGVALLPWSPTAGGILSGMYFKEGRIVTTDSDNSRVAPGSVVHKRYAGSLENDEILRRVIETAANKGVTPVQISISWLLSKGVTSPIVGTTKIAHLEEFVESTNVKLTSEESRYLEEPYPRSRFIGWD
jgi:aryl-alcohol dehydrogenase-like predicted oxidoreductase